MNKHTVLQFPPADPGPQLVSTIETITPDQAKTYLSTNRNNRRIKSRSVDYLSREIQNGNWKVTHQGIAFDSQGNIVDGQHRLHAVVKANVPVQMMVTRGVSRADAVYACDQGVIRSRADLFTMQGEERAAAKAAICRSIGHLITPDLSYGSGLGPSGDAEILTRFRAPIEQVIGSRPSWLTARPSSVVVMMLCANEERGTTFLDGLATGADLSKGDPRLTLREFLMGRNAINSGSATVRLLMLTVSAAQAFVGGESIKSLKLSSSRYAGFCQWAGLPINKSLFDYAGGTLLPKFARHGAVETEEVAP